MMVSGDLPEASKGGLALSYHLHLTIPRWDASIPALLGAGGLSRFREAVEVQQCKRTQQLCGSAV